MTPVSGFPDSGAAPGCIIRQVTDELKARKFAGEVRLQVSGGTPKKTRNWLAKQPGLEATDVYVAGHPLRISDLMGVRPDGHPDLGDPPHHPVTHGRIYSLENDGAPECLIGSPDWMKTSLDRRVAILTPVSDPAPMAEIGFHRWYHSTNGTEGKNKWLASRSMKGARGGFSKSPSVPTVWSKSSPSPPATILMPVARTGGVQ